MTSRKHIRIVGRGRGVYRPTLLLSLLFPVAVWLCVPNGWVRDDDGDGDDGLHSLRRMLACPPGLLPKARVQRQI